jgi:hypothetical protein
MELSRKPSILIPSASGGTMIKSVTIKSITAIAALALLAGPAIFFVSVVLEAKAETQVEGALPQPDAKHDRLSGLATGADCSLRGWPNYEPNCRFDLRRPAQEARTVRVIVLR